MQVSLSIFSLLLVIFSPFLVGQTQAQPEDPASASESPLSSSEGSRDAEITGDFESEQLGGIDPLLMDGPGYMMNGWPGPEGPQDEWGGPQPGDEAEELFEDEEEIEEDESDDSGHEGSETEQSEDFGTSGL